MKTNRKTGVSHAALLFISIVLFATQMPAYGQITLGSKISPEKGTLLEIKSQQADANNVTSKNGGLVLPKVELINKTTLEPFIKNDADFANNKDKIKDLHAGLVVYNLTTSMDKASVNERFLPGIYVWDGLQWQQAGDSKRQIHWFYPPAFNLPLPAIDKSTDPQRTYDLYGEYQRQFVKNMANNPDFVDTQNIISNNIPSPIDGKLYLRNELDYAIIHYDSNIIYDVAINAQGVLSYRVKDNDPNKQSFINLIFIVKQ